MSALRLRSGPRDQKPREELPLWYFSEATLVIKTSRSRCSDLPLELLTYLFSSFRAVSLSPFLFQGKLLWAEILSVFPLVSFYNSSN